MRGILRFVFKYLSVQSGQRPIRRCHAEIDGKWFNRERIKVAIVGSRGVPSRHGGFERLVEHLIAALPDAGFEVTVFCESSLRKYRDKVKKARLIYFPVFEKARIFSEVLYDIVALAWCSVADLDIIYLLGYSACPFVILPRLTGKRVAINVDGLEWRRRKFSKPIRRILKTLESIAVKVSHCIVADSELMQRYFHETYGISPMFIAYPAPIEYHSSKEAAIASLGLVKGHYYLAVARLEPENNIDLIIDGFKKAETKRRLAIVGPLANTIYVRDLMQAADSRVVFLGGIYDVDLLTAIRLNCFAYLHGHEVGGTNPSLLEAMGCGSATIALDVQFNREVAGDSALFFQKDSEDLARKIRLCEASKSKAICMREKAREIAGSKYSLNRIVTQYVNLFVRVKKGRDPDHP